MGFITVAGENQIAAKSISQDLNVVSFVLANIVGLGSEPVDRIEAMPGGGDIVATLPVTTYGYVNTNQIVYSLVMDSSLGDYDFNWVGLVDDEGVLIAVTYTPLIEKRKTAGAIPGNNLTRNFLIAYSGIQATTAIDVPAATWQIDFNARLLGIDERERLSNLDIYGHEGFLNDGWKVERQGATTNYDVLAGIGYVGGVRAKNTAVQQVVSAALKSIWLDVSLQGDISDVSAVIDFVVDAAVQNDYVDGLGFNHYLTKIADIAADGSVTDTRMETSISRISGKNKIINPLFNVNQKELAGAVVLAANEYGHDRFIAGPVGCSYTFNKVGAVTTLTITSGSLKQIIKGDNLLDGIHTLSWEGTSQGKIDTGGFSVSGMTGVAVSGTNLTVEFNTGTLTKIQFENNKNKTKFENRLYDEEIKLCYPYYQNGESTGTVDQLYGNFTNGNAFVNPIRFIGKMRVTPIINVTNTGASNFPATASNVVNIFKEGVILQRVCNGTGVGYFKDFWEADAEIYP